MQIKMKGKVIYQYSVKRLVYALCFLLLCIIDQRCKSVPGRWEFRDLTGTVMAVMILSHYRLEDFRKCKIPHLIWTAVWIIGVPIAFLHKSVFIVLADWVVIALGVVLFGYVLIQTFISAAVQKKHPKCNIKFGTVWLVMMLLMILSRSTYLWPFSYLVMFGCFYLTDFSDIEKKDMFQGMLDGIILGFFALQGWCFVFRPYDVVRYHGAFNGPNMNALFYVIVLAAVFAKILYVVKNQSNKWIRLYYWVGAGVLLSFELLTIGRMGWLTALFLVIAFLCFLAKVQLHGKWWKNLLALVLSACLTFPLCFSAIRYLPPLFHHPVWFPGEWSQSRVHSWDPWDSEKYIDLDEYAEAAVGRILESFKNVLEHSPFVLKADAAEAVPSNREPVLESSSDSFVIRKTIYSYYFKNLNLWGQPYEEQGFQLTKYFWVYHAHNIFLQYGTDFGIPVMILFVVVVVWGACILGRQYKRQQSEMAAGCWMFLLIPVIFGLFEYSWGTGSLSILLMFVAWREVLCYEG